jgi:hypothetical protein
VIVVKVELWSAITGRRTEIARAYIDNIGGDHNLGDYRVRTLRGRDAGALDRGVVQREGRVLRHPRLREHVWNLVGKALSATGYGKVVEPLQSTTLERTP